MTEIEITQRIDDIVKAANQEKDYEIAHYEEDLLQQDFIQSIADDTSLPVFLRHQAKRILALQDLDFPRWCA